MKSLVLSLIVAISLAIVSGCASEPTYFVPQSQHQQMQSGFADETYIWESFIFPKNKAESK